MSGWRQLTEALLSFALLGIMERPPQSVDLSHLGHVLLESLAEVSGQRGLTGIVDALRKTLEVAGITPDRIQLPMSRVLGFRDSTVGVLLLTWSRQEGHVVTTITHDRMNASDTHGAVGSPFESIAFAGVASCRYRLTEPDLPYELLRSLSSKSYQDYVCFGLKLPGVEQPQPMSVAAYQPFGDDVEERLLALVPLFSLAVNGAYRESQARRIAHIYIGRESGPRVIDGDIQRGHTRRVQAGILFCDIRNFTRMSEKRSAEEVVRVVNEVFQVVGEEVVPRGGEILKFIGDAMLVEFPVGESAAAVAQNMVDSVTIALSRIAHLSGGMAEPIGIGFGGHIGEVVQGNIGTKDRLDFTIMGAAVNLASRLESQCKPLGVDAVFSDAIAAHVALKCVGTHELKGVQQAQMLWTLPSS